MSLIPKDMKSILGDFYFFHFLQLRTYHNGSMEGQFMIS